MVFGNFFRKPTSLLAFAQRCIPYVSFVGSPVGTNIPVNMDYGMYPLCDRYSMDMMPEQNLLKILLNNFSWTFVDDFLLASMFVGKV